VQRQFIRFLIVGAANTLISLVVYRALLALGVWYVWNLRWTFAGRDTPRARLLYALFGAVGAVVASLLVLAFVRGAGLGKFEAYLAAVPLVTVSTFLANRYWTFSDRG